MFCRVCGVILKSELCYPCLTFRTFFPAVFRTLVPADMDVFGREYVHDFSENILKESEGVFVSGTQHFF